MGNHGVTSPSGRPSGLDRIVAEKVMGWTLVDRVAAGWGVGPDVYRTGDEANPTYEDFEPSRSIADAWMVAEKMNADWCTFRVQYVRVTDPQFAKTYWAAGYERRPWSYRGSLSDKSVWAEEATAPLAICVCVLRAVGVHESEITEAMQ